MAAAVAAVAVAAAAVAADQPDRIGLGWRGELAAGIFSNLDRIDLLEVIADDYYHASPAELRALRTLSAHRPISLHGVAMGLASTAAPDLRRIENMARLVNTLQPESWSEHLAFVRGGGIEIGHLAAPPRTAESVAASIVNIERAQKIVGRAPAMENIATLIRPPASTLDEAAWVSQIIGGTDASCLLDLHNLYANALNFGEEAEALLLRFPLHKVSTVHLSGGHWVAEPGNATPPAMRLLDDHVHDVPPQVFSLLTLLARHAEQALTVILERDGNYPPFDSLLAQLDAARDALQLGRTQKIRQTKAA